MLARKLSPALLVCLVVLTALGADWPRFRGPDGSGISDATGLPQDWSATENLAWKTPLPGAGASSPIVWGDKIFITCYSGYGLDKDEPGDIHNLTRHLVCVDAGRGKILWDKAEKAAQPEQAYTGFITLHGYASSSPVTDGESVFVFYGRSGVLAYDFEGQQRWHAAVGEKTDGWGSGTSPILHANLVIINASIESGSLVALDKKTGKEVWRTENIVRSWSTPVLVPLAGGGEDLVVNMKGKVLGLDPATGKERWQCVGIDDYICPELIADHGVVYATGGRKPMSLAVKAGGQGDVSEKNVLWRVTKSTKVPAPVASDGLLYWVENRGIAMCLEAATGKTVYEEKMDIPGGGDKLYASLVLADGKLYCVTRQGGTIVLAAGKEFKELARNNLGDKSVFNATPAVVPGGLILRSDRALYRVGK